MMTDIRGRRRRKRQRRRSKKEGEEGGKKEGRGLGGKLKRDLYVGGHSKNNK